MPAVRDRRRLPSVDGPVQGSHVFRRRSLRIREHGQRHSVQRRALLHHRRHLPGGRLHRRPRPRLLGAGRPVPRRRLRRDGRRLRAPQPTNIGDACTDGPVPHHRRDLPGGRHLRRRQPDVPDPGAECLTCDEATDQCVAICPPGTDCDGNGNCADLCHESRPLGVLPKHHGSWLQVLPDRQRSATTAGPW